jgi:hypothetical protein
MAKSESQFLIFNFVSVPITTHYLSMSSFRRMYNQAIGSSSDDGIGNVDLRTELERVSSRLNSFNQLTASTNMDDWMQAMQSYAEEVATLEPKLTVVSKLVRDELRQIKGKEEGDIHGCFQQQMNEHKKVGCLA